MCAVFIAVKTVVRMLRNEEVP